MTSAVPPLGTPRRGLVLGYEVLGTMAVLCLTPLLLVAWLARRDWRAEVSERLGILPRTPPGQPSIWIHAASVGEVTAVVPLVRTLHDDLPQHRLVVSALTRTGRAVAQARLGDVATCVFLPLDVPVCVGRALDAVRPQLLLFSETELWPALFAALERRRVPAAMVSGRLSATAFMRYRRWRALFGPTLVAVRCFAVQSIQSARRLTALGAPAARVVVTGSLKNAPGAERGDAVSLRGLGADGWPVVVAGSTHEGEEQIVLDAWARVHEAVPATRLVLAPRHPERFDDVAALLEARGQHFVRRSALGEQPWPADCPVLLLDSLGELRGMYAGAVLAFVGGTLAPVGGHNVLEPAMDGVPVAFGAHVDNVRADAARLRTMGGGVEVADAADLAEVVRTLVTNPATRAERGARAAEAAPIDHGPLVVTLGLVRGLLAEGG